MITSEFLNSLPMNPGVYIMKNKSDKVIYVGKAKKLKNRVKQYFQHNSNHTNKVLAMVSHIDHLEYIVTNSEVEALNLECSLIKKYSPKYNILLKDDKSYPYIKITNEDFPQMVLARRNENDGGKYFGPFISSYTVKNIIDLMKKTFKIRGCRGPINGKAKKPCLNYHINRCDAPCCGKISKEQYAENINEAVKALNSNSSELVAELKNKMNNASENLNFELAAQIRDRIDGIKKISESQLVVSTDIIDEDIVCLYKESDYVCIQMMFVRDGKLIDKKAFFMNNTAEETDNEILSAFLVQHYSSFYVPKFIYVSVMPEDSENIEEMLSEIKESRVYIKMPQKGDKYKFVIMAKKNASEAIRIKEMQNGKHDNTDAIIQLKNYLGLDKMPQRIEAYDISNTAGEEITGSMVVFVNGLASKNNYRKFKVKTLTHQDDYESMKEVLRRRLLRAIEKQDEKFKKMPDLILVDGGKGQVSAAKQVLHELNVNIPLFGIIKDSKHRTRDIVSQEKEFNIPMGTKCFKLITNIQDEMHRVAINYHKFLRNAKNMESELMTVDGLGLARYKLLITHFKTINAIKRADEDEISSIKGISKELSKKIVEFCKKNYKKS